MTDLEDDKLWDEIVKAIETRITEQIHWHVQHGSIGDKNQLFEISLRMEAENLERRARNCDEEGQDVVAIMLRALKEALPEILKNLRDRI